MFKYLLVYLKNIYSQRFVGKYLQRNNYILIKI